MWNRINLVPGDESVDLYCGRITADLNQRWLLVDGDVGVFRAHDALEHLRDPIYTMKELHRCQGPQGWLLSRTPRSDVHQLLDFELVLILHPPRPEPLHQLPPPSPGHPPEELLPERMPQRPPDRLHKADLLKVAGQIPGAVATWVINN